MTHVRHRSTARTTRSTRSTRSLSPLKLPKILMKSVVCIARSQRSLFVFPNQLKARFGPRRASARFGTIVCRSDRFGSWQRCNYNPALCAPIAQRISCSLYLYLVVSILYTNAATRSRALTFWHLIRSWP